MYNFTAVLSAYVTGILDLGIFWRLEPVVRKRDL